MTIPFDVCLVFDMDKLFLLPSELLSQTEIDRINKMFESPKRRCTKYIEARALVCPIISEYYFNLWSAEVEPVLITNQESLMGHKPIISPKLPSAIPMRHRIFTFGIGNTNDVPLDRFGYCQYVSPKHALIFYDEIENQYELVNYSCYGTFVNNILAANNEIYPYICYNDSERVEKENEEQCNISEDWIKTEDGPPLNYKHHLITTPRRPFMKNGSKNCFCEATHFETLTKGWEGSVPVPCGSILRFGCISFIFSVINVADDSIA